MRRMHSGWVIGLALVSAAILAGCQVVGPLQTLVAPKTAIPLPTASPTIRSAPAEAITESVTPTQVCGEVAPFGADCPPVARPDVLTANIDLVGILPASPRVAPVWSPDGHLLAYAPDEGSVAVRAWPDYTLVAQWDVPAVFDLSWAPDGTALSMVFDRGDDSSIAYARLDKEGWADLLPGTRAELAMNQSKVVEDWLDAHTLVFRVGCGTGCGSLYSLDVGTMALAPLVNVAGTAGLEVGEPPYGDQPGTRYLFSDDGQRLAVTDWTTGLPDARVLAWPGPADPIDLSTRLDGRYTEALEWSGNDLLFTAYPPGEPDAWEDVAQTELYVWNAVSDAIQPLVPGAFWATVSPDGSRLVAHLVGAPEVDETGAMTVTGRIPYVALFAWPERILLASEPASDHEPASILDFIYSLQPRFSPDGTRLAYQPGTGGVALLDDQGQVQPVVANQFVDGIAWGGEADLVIYVREELWVLRLG